MAHSDKHHYDRSDDRDPSRILIVAHDARRRSWIDRAIKQNDLTCEAADSSAEALMLVLKYDGGTGEGCDKAFDAVVIDTPVCTPAAMKLMRELGQRHIATLLVCPQVTFEQAVEVMRTGAADIIPADVKPRELCKRLRAALKIDAHDTESTATRVKADAATKGQPMSTDAKADGEFARLIQGELDVETLLRHALEFVLARVGPTNAAVFLPGSTGEYALGAYVNLSCPKDTAEVMLDHLANTAAPKLENTVGVIDLSDPATLEKALGEGAEWLQGQRVLAFACRQENECLAVFVLFREESRPFAADSAQALSMVRDEFGRQLARVIRIHHRHLPRDKWGAPGDGWDSAEDDLAA